MATERAASRIKLSKAQEALLRKIVASNGGGLDVDAQNRTVKILYKHDLIQGKSGRQHWAVHTREGLEWVRNNPLVKS